MTKSLLDKAVACRKEGAPDQAQIYLEQFLAKEPQHPKALSLQGMLYMDRQQLDAALPFFLQSLKHNPQQPDIHYLAGHIRMCQMQWQEAIRHLITVIRLQSDHMLAHLSLSHCLAKQRKYDQALKMLQSARQMAPDHAQVAVAIVALLREVGRTEEARQMARALLDEFPEELMLFYQLVSLKEVTADDDIVANLEKKLDAGKIEAKERSNLCFMLGDLYARANVPSRAYRFYEEGNRLKRPRITPAYSTESEQEQLEKIRRYVGPATVEADPSAYADLPIPVFIVGMPRSGTSLVEQIFSSHSQAEGAGEQEFMPRMILNIRDKEAHHPYPQVMERLDGNGPKIYHSLGNYYLKQLKEIAPSARYICDKLPHNFLYVGAIRRIFPQAKVIYCQRNPMDVCWSIFTKSFDGIHNFSYRQEDIASHYRFHEQLMQHWQETCPGFIHTAVYESMIDDPEGEIRKLLAFCGMPFEEQCLRFYETERAVATASNDQVRQPLYRSSIGRWKPYADYLGPLKEAFSEASEEEVA